MDLSEIERIHAEHCRPGFGTTTPDELEYIQHLIREHRPKRFIEIGTASGLTTGFIARFLEENGGVSVTSVDLSDTFFGDRSKPTGYLAKEICTGSEVEIVLVTGRTSLDLAELGGPWDMAFVDANHQNPWPIIDTLAVAPHMTGSKIVIHHDLQLYRRYKAFRGIGPRVLFNEMPNSHRHAVPANGWNIFSIDLGLDQLVLEQVAIGALSMPWTARPWLNRETAQKVKGLISRHYSAELVAEFDECLQLNSGTFPGRVLFHIRQLLRRL